MPNLPTSEVVAVVGGGGEGGVIVIHGSFTALMITSGSSSASGDAGMPNVATLIRTNKEGGNRRVT